MSTYYDTGIILKLYTEEPDSPAARKLVTRRRVALHVTELHRAEFVNALRLKCFRRECSEAQAEQALAHLEEDFQAGILRMAALDWDAAWGDCRALSIAHAARTGCRTLDALHVAGALQLGCREFVTTDARQGALARICRLKVITPLD